MAVGPATRMVTPMLAVQMLFMIIALLISIVAMAPIQTTEPSGGNRNVPPARRHSTKSAFNQSQYRQPLIE